MLGRMCIHCSLVHVDHIYTCFFSWVLFFVFIIYFLFSLLLLLKFSTFCIFWSFFCRCRYRCRFRRRRRRRRCRHHRHRCFLDEKNKRIKWRELETIGFAGYVCNFRRLLRTGLKLCVVGVAFSGWWALMPSIQFTKTRSELERKRDRERTFRRIQANMCIIPVWMEGKNDTKWKNREIVSSFQ